MWKGVQFQATGNSNEKKVGGSCWQPSAGEGNKTSTISKIEKSKTGKVAWHRPLVRDLRFPQSYISMNSKQVLSTHLLTPAGQYSWSQ